MLILIKRIILNCSLIRPANVTKKNEIAKFVFNTESLKAGEGKQGEGAAGCHSQGDGEQVASGRRQFTRQSSCYSQSEKSAGHTGESYNPCVHRQSIMLILKGLNTHVRSRVNAARRVPTLFIAFRWYNCEPARVKARGRLAVYA